MDQGDPEKRLADLEHRLAEQKDPPARDDPDVAVPSQTPGYWHRQRRNQALPSLLSIPLVFVGLLVVSIDARIENDKVGLVAWLGIAMALLGVLMIVGSAIRPVARRKHKKEAALQEPGTVELITFKAAYDVQLNQRRIWDLTSKMQIRLDSGGTFRGSYRTDVGLWTLQRWWRRAFPPQPGRLSRPFPNTQREAIDAIFHVGASWPCLYNPKNPDVVVVFPFPPLDDELNEQLEGTDHIEFWSAT